MNRRQSIKAIAAVPASMAAAQGQGSKPIQLHVDLELDPKREAEMLKNYKATFRPAISKQPGFVDVKLLKLRKEVAGKAPANCPYRLIISFQTEEQRQKWVASDLHQKVWPTIEATLKGQKYIVLLYDPV